MAYVYQNGSLGRAIALRGLGAAPSYEQAYAQYQQAHDAWLGQVNLYRSASASWAAGEAQKSRTYADAQAAYQTAHAAEILDQTRWEILKKVLIGQGATIPSDFPGCVTQAQHDAWQKTCDQMSSVKGLGLGALPTGNPCQLAAAIPVCKPRAVPPVPPVASPAPLPPGPEPQPPVKPAPAPVTGPPSSIPASPGPSMMPPSGGGGDGSGGGGGTGPSMGPSTPLTPAPLAPKKAGGLLSSGLILVVIAGGSYALYRTFKKPRAA